MSNEVTKATSNEVSTEAANLSSWGLPEVTQHDIVIPRMLVMQGLSEFVTSGIAKFGDIVDSLTQEVLGDSKNAVEFIPFYVDKVFYIQKMNADKEYKFDRIEKVTAQNVNLPYEDAEGGVPIRRYYALQFYAILPKSPELPYVITFKSKALKTGKQLYTQMYVKQLASGVAPAAKVMALSTRNEKNAKGTYAVPVYNVVRDSTPEELQRAYEWMLTLKSGKAKVDTTDDISAHPEAATEPMF